MSPRLQDFPSEIIETIVGFLAFGDICNLRLCSREIAARSTQIRFKSFFHSKRVEITERALQEFVHVTQAGLLGCHLQHLVLVGIVHEVSRQEAQAEWTNRDVFEHLSAMERRSGSNPEKWGSENAGKLRAVTQARARHQENLLTLEQRQLQTSQLHDSGTAVKLLSEALGNLRTNGINGRLLSLTLEAVGQDTEKRLNVTDLSRERWRPIWKCAAETFHTTIRSQSASRLSIEKFTVFNDRQLQRCSLACTELCQINFEDEGLAISFASLKSLSLSISSKDIYPVDENELRTWIEDEACSIALVKLFQLCIHLKEFELHQYYLNLSRPRRINPNIHQEWLLQNIAKLDHFPKLDRLELRGVFISEEDLYALAQRTEVHSLTMHNTHLTSGVYRNVFDHCSSDTTPVRDLYFENLYEDGAMIYFNGPGKPSFPWVGAVPNGPNILRRRGAEQIHQHIRYSRNVRGRPADSPALRQHRQHMLREYGPPDRGN